MKERPIFMPGDNPRLIIEGRKTQTRQMIKPQPVSTARSKKPWCSVEDLLRKCPYGIAGDRLWLREEWAHERQFDHLRPTKIPQSAHDTKRVMFGAQIINGWHKRRQLMHMPRWASRITLEILEVRVERVQDISEEDAKAEGMNPMFKNDLIVLGRVKGPCVGAYAFLWDSLHGKGSWAKNPWVWVIEFKKIAASNP